MKKITKLLAVLGIAFAGALVPANKPLAAGIDYRINEHTFPDAVFREYVKKNFDLNSDGRLSMEERKKVTKIALKDVEFESLSGVQLFPELTEIDCVSNGLKQVNLTHNPKLTKISISRLEQDHLDLSQNTKLQYLSLDWYDKNGKLDLSKNTELKELYISTYLDSIDLSKNTKLTSLTLGTSSKTIDLSKNTKLTYLSVWGPVEKIDLSKNTQLELLRLYTPKLASIDLKNNKKLTDLVIDDDVLESLSLDNQTALEKLTLYTAKLKKLSQCRNSNMRCFWLERASMDVLDLTKYVAVSDVMLQDTQIKELKLNSDQLRKLDIARNTGMQYLDLSNCHGLRSAYNSGEKKSDGYGRVIYKKGLNQLRINTSVKVINHIVVYTTIIDENMSGITYKALPCDKKTGGTVSGAGVYNTGDVVTIKASVDTKNAYTLDAVYSGKIIFADWKDGVQTKEVEKVKVLTKADSYQFTAKEDMAFVVMIKNLVPYELGFDANSRFAFGGKVNAYLTRMDDYKSYPATTYQWYRGTKKIEGATDLNYTIKKEDIGQELSFVVTTASGGKKAITTEVIEKQAGLNAEIELEVKAASREGRADGQILGVNTSMEYSTSKDFKNKKTCPKTKMTVKAGTYYIRYAETSISKAGKIAVVKVPDGPSVTDVFNDLEKDAWYIDAVKYVYAKGIMNGVSGNKFEPMSVTTRAEFVTMLYNLAGAPKVSKKADFKDVGKGDWYENAVNWAYTYDITSGVSETKFGPDQKITRQQAAAMFYKYAVYKKLDTTGDKKALDKFSDKNKVESWAKTGLEWAVHQGVINGKLKGQTTILAPNDKITRAECAQMIKNMAERVKTKK